MRNKVEVCDTKLEENLYKKGSMWVSKKDQDHVLMITSQGYIDLSNGLIYITTKFEPAFKNYTQVYCITIKRDRSG